MKEKRDFRKAVMFVLLLFIILMGMVVSCLWPAEWKVVDTGQEKFFNANGQEISSPSSSSALYGQDAHYKGLTPSYTDNGDGTITDNNTGLMWQKDPGDKKTYTEAVAGLSSFRLAGYSDWRMPTIKELYSLIKFNGTDPSGEMGNDTSSLKPFIDTNYFVFNYGDTSIGDRIIDSQWISSTKYVSTTMNGRETGFGVNMADGRIKGYPIDSNPNGSAKGFYVIYVRGRTDYGVNNFVDNGDGTVTDQATGLMWMQKDSGPLKAGDDKDGAMNWTQALEWAEKLEYAGYSDWRLPNAKELQSIVDYSRSPATTNSAAIDPVFSTSSIIDEGGSKNYPFYWTGTHHIKSNGNGDQSVYVAFGEALGWMELPPSFTSQLMDVHGAGAQRSDPKTGDPSDYPVGFGPQGDVRRIYNYVRCVRDAGTGNGGGNTGGGGTGGGGTGGGGENPTAQISLSQTNIYFGAVQGKSSSRSKTIQITISGSGTVNWTAAADASWLTVSPSSGTGSGIVTLTPNGNVNALPGGSYDAAVTVSSSAASNSPQTAKVYLKVYSTGSPPFGSYATPSDHSVVSSSVAFTGWVLDDVGVASVKLYRLENGSLQYIGDAALVEGARPDVEQSYPDYPDCSQAGWGYMMLTHFLPGGNGTFTIYAIATDLEGQQTTLGSRTITVDNKSAVKPFGAIDTPAQGGIASGDGYICWGWALTPTPNNIPNDGSTINVIVDGKNVGHPVYNIYRSDIASLFPGYANTNGAIGYFYLDTTGYEDGVHTIQWTVKDNAGNSDGIGSRYFTIQNLSSSSQSTQTSASASIAANIKTDEFIKSLKNPGKARNSKSIQIKEMQPISVVLGEGSGWQGYLKSGNRLKSLPVGSTLDHETGTFHWLPGPGFFGNYSLIFTGKGPNGAAMHTTVDVTIRN